MFINMKNKIFLFAFLFFSLLGLFAFSDNVKALSLTYPEYNVFIEIEENSVVNIVEEADYVFTGNLNGIRRDITLYDAQKASQCAVSSNKTCGGFEFLILNDIFLDQNTLSQDDYELYNYSPDESSTNYFRIEKRLFNNETYVDEELFEFDIDYSVYGSIQWLSSFNQTEESPIFYWNVLPERRNGPVESSQIEIKFPENVDILEQNFDVYKETLGDYDLVINQIDNTATFDFGSLPSTGAITIAYFFEPDDLIRPGGIDFDFENSYFGETDIFLNGDKIVSRFSDEFKYFPAGEYSFSFDRLGFERKDMEIEVNSNEITKITVNLERELWLNSFIGAVILTSVAGLILTLPAGWIVYKRYLTRGKDKDMPKTIVPEYKPPKDVSPYLVGSLIDEKVDKKDVSATIIDLAYRGFIKIKELSKGKYELIRINKEKENELKNIEQDIVKAFFGSSNSVKTEDLKKKKSVYEKYKKVISSIYTEMVNKGFFEDNPNNVRNTYFGIGITLTIISLILLVAASVGASFLSGIYLPALIFLPIFVYGLTTLAYANFMPAKTKLGSDTYAKILGFKMYMETAERFRVQNLKPEDFEKYLSYAIVFGVEKKWAEKFKDIYNEPPTWYEGSDFTDAVIFASLMNNLNSAAVGTLTASQSVATGGGWSGGGSFGGGFAGGGGGGGSSGGW